MGYYTNYQIETEWIGNNAQEALDAFDESFSCNVDEQTKWYDHEDDMIALSLKFPDILFTLRGEGEESGDLWKKYFHDGRMQVCKAVVTFGEFDKSKLGGK